MVWIFQFPPQSKGQEGAASFSKDSHAGRAGISGVFLKYLGVCKLQQIFPAGGKGFIPGIFLTHAPALPPPSWVSWGCSFGISDFPGKKRRQNVCLVRAGHCYLPKGRNIHQRFLLQWEKIPKNQHLGFLRRKAGLQESFPSREFWEPLSLPDPSLNFIQSLARWKMNFQEFHRVLEALGRRNSKNNGIFDKFQLGFV